MGGTKSGEKCVRGSALLVVLGYERVRERGGQGLGVGHIRLGPIHQSIDRFWESASQLGRVV